MATTVSRYVSKCQEVVDAKPAYKNGASSLTECDCIGMDKYAFRECGVSFSTSGTNYTIRNQVEDIHNINGTSDLTIGDVVFKYRKPGDSGYDLPAKYQKGGAQYNGDLNDYYHIGTVKSVYPLRIIHMTTPTAKTDTKIGKWAVAAKWQAKYIKDGGQASEPTPEPDPEPTPEPTPTPDPEKAVVWSENGKPVNLRARPSRAAALVERIKVGETVEVVMEGEEWCLITWRGKTGYMMTEFLIMPDAVLYTVEIPHLTSEQVQALKDMYPGAVEKEERG